MAPTTQPHDTVRQLWPVECFLCGGTACDCEPQCKDDGEVTTITTMIQRNRDAELEVANDLLERLSALTRETTEQNKTLKALQNDKEELTRNKTELMVENQTLRSKNEGLVKDKENLTKQVENLTPVKVIMQIMPSNSKEEIHIGRNETLPDIRQAIINQAQEGIPHDAQADDIVTVSFDGQDLEETDTLEEWGIEDEAKMVAVLDTEKIEQRRAHPPPPSGLTCVRCKKAYSQPSAKECGCLSSCGSRKWANGYGRGAKCTCCGEEC